MACRPGCLKHTQHAGASLLDLTNHCRKSKYVFVILILTSLSKLGCSEVWVLGRSRLRMIAMISVVHEDHKTCMHELPAALLDAHHLWSSDMMDRSWRIMVVVIGVISKIE